MEPIVQQAMTPDIIRRIEDAGIVAVLIIDKLEHAAPLAKALIQGGVNAIELTLRTPVAMDAARVIKEVEQRLPGTPTVLAQGPQAREMVAAIVTGTNPGNPDD